MRLRNRLKDALAADQAAVGHMLMGFYVRGMAQMLDPDTLTGMLGQLDRLARLSGDDGRPVPVITPPGLRVGVRRLIEPVLPNIPVVSLAELPPQVNLQSIATWELDNAA